MRNPRRSASLFALIVPLVLSFGLYLGCKKKAPLSRFEKLQADAYQKNPDGLKVELRTRDGRSSYHLYETIPIDLVFSSSKAVTYSIELVESMNPVGSANRFWVDPVNTVFAPFGVQGYVCCGSIRPYLWSEPTVLHRDLTDYLRFETPGRYRVFYTTQRVFLGKRNGRAGDVYQQLSDLTVASNLLVLTIFPDDPEWDARKLSETLQALRDPKVVEEYNEAGKKASMETELQREQAYFNEIPETKFARAEKALRNLDTEAAIRERVSLIPQMKRHTYASPDLIASTTQPDRMFKAMTQRAQDGTVVIDDNYVELWTAVLVRRDHPELFRPRLDDTFLKDRFKQYPVAEIAADEQILALLKDSLSSKKGTARIATQETIEDLQEQLSRQRTAEDRQPTGKP